MMADEKLHQNVSEEDPFHQIRVLPGGAKFYRCALQVNPHGYKERFRGEATNGDSRAHAKAIIEKAAELGITVLAITDHNDAGGVQAFREAAAGYPEMHIFPGFEVTSSEGVHVLCIYPQATDEQQLGRYLGKLGLCDPGPSSDPSELSFTDLLAKVRQQGGITIAAHATNSGGLFEVLKGQPRVLAWKDRNLLAIQIPGRVEDLPQGVREIVENRNPEYCREDAPEDRLACAVVNARDIVEPAELEEKSATCWIKMSEVGIEGLRQAFLDPGSRIRPNPLESQEHTELLGISWTGGFLGGTALRFNRNLNVLIGGRGAGKSTVIESLRAVLGLEVLGDEARRAHEGIVGRVLQSGTKITLLVRVHHPVTREYSIVRTLPDPPRVRDGNGETSNLAPVDILPGLEIYGQREISELAHDGQKLTRLLERFTHQDGSARSRRSSLRRKLTENRRSLLDVQVELRQTDERLERLPGLEETLERFREAGVEEKLQERSVLVREEQILDSISERLEFVRESRAILDDNLPLDRVFLSPQALDELPGQEILARAGEILARLSEELEGVAASLASALERAEAQLESVRGRWQSRKDEVQVAYEKILRELQKSKVDGEEFIRLREDIEHLRPLRERRDRLLANQEDLRARRQQLLTEWENHKDEEYRHFERAAKRVNRTLRDSIEIQVRRSGNREPLLDLLRNGLEGRLSETFEALQQREDLSIQQLANTCRDGADALRERYGLTLAQAERLANAEESLLLQIEELDLPSTTEIRLNTASDAGDPVWRSLDELSTGQRATAVLLLLLEGDAPLIVDQPEDDLDNRFISEGIVPRMREAKQRRQFFFSTHNANIPVLGDAELIVGLTPHGEADHGYAQIDPEHMGSIDDGPVRELVEKLLEGGKEAFERRRRKYGF